MSGVDRQLLLPFLPLQHFQLGAVRLCQAKLNREVSRAGCFLRLEYLRLKRGSESKIKCDSVGDVQPEALLVPAGREEMEPVLCWGLVLTCVMVLVLSSAVLIFLGARFLFRNLWSTLP